MNPEITLANYEEYLILHTDGELTAAEESALEAFLKAHPELAGEVSMYAAAKLTPDETIRFEGAADLLRPEPEIKAPRRMALLPWSLAAAAALAGLIVGIRMLNAPAGAPRQPLAQTQPVMPSSTPQGTPPAMSNPAPRPSAPGTAAPVVARQEEKRTGTAVLRLPAAPPATAAAAVRTEEPQLTRLEPVPAATLEVVTLDLVTMQEPVTPPVAELPQPQQNRLLQALPVDGQRLEALTSLKETAKNNLQRVKAVRQNLKNTEATFALAGHELFTLRF